MQATANVGRFVNGSPEKREFHFVIVAVAPISIPNNDNRSTLDKLMCPVSLVSENFALSEIQKELTLLWDPADLYHRTTYRFNDFSS